MMMDTVARFGGSKTITGEDIRELREELLNLRRNSDESGMGESGLRCGRGVEDNRLWAVGVDHLAPLDVDEKVEVLQ